MRLCVTGANGAVGRALVRIAGREPALEVVAVVRSSRAAAQVPIPVGARCRVAVIDGRDPAGLDAALEGARAVVHLPGVLFEGPGSRYEEANRETTRRVAEAAVRQGVRRAILVSALGVHPGSANRYWRTKGEAEEILRKAELESRVFRVPILLGRGTPAAKTLARQVRSGRAWLLGGGRTWHQPLDVEDLARVLLAEVQAPAAQGIVVALAGPERVRHRAWVERAAALAGRRVRIGSVPLALARAGAWLGRRLGPGGLTPEVLEVLLRDDEPVDGEGVARMRGITLTPLDVTLRASLEGGEVA